MTKKIFVLIFLFLLPLIAKAEEATLATKLEKWRESFENQDVDLIAANKDYFSLTEDEANLLFNSESKKYKNSPAKDFKIVLGENYFTFQAVFKRILRGRIYFEAQPLENKIGIRILKAKCYGLRVPAKWVEKPINKELDEYFGFLYQNDKYRKAKLVIRNKTAKLLLEF